MADGNAVASRDPFDTYVEKVEAPDPYTLVVTFTEPYAPWQTRIFSNVNATQAIPKHVLQPVFDKEGTIDNAEWNRNPTVGVGAFPVRRVAIGQSPHLCRQPQLSPGRPQDGPGLYQDRARRLRPDSRHQGRRRRRSACSSPTRTCPTCKSWAHWTWLRLSPATKRAGTLTSAPKRRPRAIPRYRTRTCAGPSSWPSIETRSARSCSMV